MDRCELCDKDRDELAGYCSRCGMRPHAATALRALSRRIADIGRRAQQAADAERQHKHVTFRIKKR